MEEIVMPAVKNKKTHMACINLFMPNKIGRYCTLNAVLVSIPKFNH
jgi:hypothetical protein